MFKIVDGREYFYQWDLDRQVAVEDATITEVHFCNRTDECSLVVEVVDGVANVPNIILQKSFNVRVFGYDGKATRYDKVFEVKARSKPSDYVYTEVEIKNYDDLAARLAEIEEKGFSEEVINKAVSDYMEKNPVDLDGYATEDYVDEAVKNVEVDLTGYATKEYVQNELLNIDIPEPEKVDLTGYAKEQWVKDQGYLTEHQDLSSYAKRADIPTKVSQLSNDKGYLTKHQDISHLATIGQVQTVEGKIPTKTSQLTNDSGFLTQHQDISGKADRDHTHPSYALKTEIPSLDGYATEKYVDDAIAGIEIPEGSDVDLTDYYTKEETDALISNINECDTYFFDPGALDFNLGLNNSVATLPEHMVEYVTRMLAGDHVDLEILDATLSRLMPAEAIVSGENTVDVVRGISIYDTANTPEVTTWRFYPSNNSTTGWVAVRLNKYTLSIATRDYVDDAIANIDIPDGGNSNVYTINIVDDSCTNTTTELRPLFDKIVAGENVFCYWNCAEGVYHTRVRKASDTSVLITPSFSYIQSNEVKFIPGQLNIQCDDNSIVIIYNRVFNTATAPTTTKVEQMIADAIQDALNSIDVAEGGAY